jgi:hypothetical protein
MDTAHAILDDGAALDTLRRFVSLTGGTPHAVDTLLGVPDDYRAAPAEPVPRGLPQNAPATGRLAVPPPEKEMTAC